MVATCPHCTAKINDLAMEIGMEISWYQKCPKCGNAFTLERVRIPLGSGDAYEWQTEAATPEDADDARCAAARRANISKERYRVEVYTERNGTIEWCVCDFGDEVKIGTSPVVRNGWSPKVRNAFGDGRWATSDRAEAERIAQALNAGLRSVDLVKDEDDYGRRVTVPVLSR
jgi:hypothetical protein